MKRKVSIKSAKGRKVIKKELRIGEEETASLKLRLTSCG